MEKKKRREKVTMSKKLVGPRIIEKDCEQGKIVVVPALKLFGGASKAQGLVCAVTGRPARYSVFIMLQLLLFYLRYTDPVTGLPYSSKLAFKVIRDKYYKYLRTVKNREDVNELLSSIE